MLLSAPQSAIQTTQNPNCTHPEFLSSFYLASPFFYLPAVYQITLHTTHGQSRTFPSPFPARMYAIKSKKKVPPPPHTHTHTQSQAGQVSLKITLSFRFRVQKFLPDWQRRVFYAHFYFGYVEQEKNCPVTCPLIYVPLRRL